ncbi:alpha-amylase [Bacillus aquiflavi]|uniref:alpha-amylase n=1 Tax=Bacillus aquiflavi TaxID=2672567 RepID=A0A6B3W582_9BACI|nr:alpha-amylase family glycosyl hydrolase [Bacillus aquiflavi]MBA4538772.1 alpha-amylase [Bacillus aquiflavi]NEY83123.1 alpha-amylase [Bacillus aquiflavi]UAC49042.1 alpha-amylase [Bacillus aquiflavi]
MKKGVITLMLIPLLLFYTLPVEGAEKEERTWQDETIYFLMIDRFYNGDTRNDFEVNRNDPLSFYGGDFQGIIDKLDYLKEMGFTTLLLTPIFDNDEKGYHGYWMVDYYKPDEHFGSLGKFRELVKEAHNRDMKVMVDFVTNYVGKNHPWVSDPNKKDWFSDQLVNGLPQLALENNDVQKYLIDAAKWWVEETDLDGYRLEGVEQAPHSFWKDFVKEVKGVKKDFFLLGEITSDHEEEIGNFENTGIDGFLDYPKTQTLRNAFAMPDQSSQMLFSFPADQNQYLRGTFLDNHLMKRFTNDAAEKNKHPGPRWKLALTYLYTSPGIPIVYYGSEIALAGEDIPENRAVMDFRTDQDLIDYISKIGKLRQDLPSLTKGTLEFLYEKNGMMVFKRTYKEETVVIAINNTSKTQIVTLDDKMIEGGKELRGLLAGDLVRSNEENKYNIVIDREEAEIYVLAEKTKIKLSFIIGTVAVWVIFILFLYVVWKKAKTGRS